MTETPIAAGKSSFDLIHGQQFLETLNLQKGLQVLDLACGRGDYSVAMAPAVAPAGQVHAFDLHAPGIESLRSQIAEHKIPNIHAEVVDVSRPLPLDAASIDLCLLASVVHDLVEDGTDQATLKQVKQVLKADGTLAVVEFKKIDGPLGPPIHIRLSPTELQALLEPHGFVSKAAADVGPHHYLELFQRR